MKKLEKHWLMKKSNFIKGDIGDLDDLFKASEGCSAVIHAAALSTVWGKWGKFL